MESNRVSQRKAAWIAAAIVSAASIFYAGVTAGAAAGGLDESTSAVDDVPQVRSGVSLIGGNVTGAAVAVASAGLLGLLLYLAQQLRLRRGEERKASVKHARESCSDMLRTAMGLFAQAAGVRVLVLREDQQLDLIGEWRHGSILSEGRSTLQEVIKYAVNGEALRVSILDAMHKRDAWSGIVVLQADGESATYQLALSPMFESDGTFMAMLGVSTDITDALKTQSQVQRDENFRNAQAQYLRQLLLNINEPANHLLAVVRRISAHPEVASRPDLNRLMSLGLTETLRLSEVVRNSVQLMQLRSADIREHLTPLLVRPLVQSVADSLLAIESSKGVDIEGQVDRKVLAHEPSLRLMLRITIADGLRYSHDGGHVVVRMSEEDHHLRLEVEHDESGMKDTAIAELTTLGVPERAARSSGLGFATLLEIAHHAGAAVLVGRSENSTRGLSVCVKLPWAT